MFRKLLLAVSVFALSSVAAGQAKQDSPAAGAPLPRAKFVAGMDAEFRKIDTDGNGKLTRMEIEQHQKSQAAAQAEARNKELFVQLDADRNGRLSQAEFAKMITPASTANAQPMIARMDGDRDDQISLVEHRTATVANFDRLDTDRDGVVTAAEMKAGGIAPR